MSIPATYHPDPVSPVELDAAESKHLVRVLRLREGAAVRVADGKGNMYDASITKADPVACVIRVGRLAFTEPANGLHLLVAPTKQMSRYEWMLEKATEMGLARLTPLVCKYSERKWLTMNRLLKTACSAMKQSGRARLPQIDAPVSFEEGIRLVSDGAGYIATCATDIARVKMTDQQRSVAVLIGPEGDFGHDEVEMAMANGFECVTLGPWRLRTESAAIAACAWYNIQCNA